jgi:hypothetical protein
VALVNAEWYLMRGSGVVSLILLTVVFALGIATSKRFRPSGLPLYVTTTVHRNASLLAVSFLGIHIGTAVLDTYSHVPLTAVLVPFGSHWRPFWVGLGTLALDLLAAVVVTEPRTQAPEARDVARDPLGRLRRLADRLPARARRGHGRGHDVDARRGRGLPDGRGRCSGLAPVGSV